MGGAGLGCGRHQGNSTGNYVDTSCTNDSIMYNYMYNTNRWCWLNRVLYNTNLRGREEASLEEVGLGGFPLLRPIVYIYRSIERSQDSIVETVVATSCT